ncbi:4Fe-4S binding protein [Candidatus Woesearchaeota archaeon]|nr:4Fe-4S binding protein [Candidatus Woesearchaeota archaeon]
MGKREDFAIAFLIFISIIFLIFQRYFDFSMIMFSDIYIGLVYLLIVLIFLQTIFDWKFLKKKLIYYIFFLPIAIYPVLKCYFKIPYIFCKSCPRKCIWGHLREFIVQGFIIINIDKRSWCFNYCPFGYLQDLNKKTVNKRITLPKKLGLSRYVVLAAIIYLLLFFGRFGFKAEYSVTLIVLIFTAVIFILSFVVHRFFCNYFCPIGAVGDLVLKLEKLFKKRQS